MAVPGGFLEDRAWVLWNFSPIFGHLTLFRWLKFEILTLVIYHTPLPMLLQVSFQFDLIEHVPDFQNLLKQDQMMNCLESLKLVCIWYSWTSFHKKIWVRRKS